MAPTPSAPSTLCLHGLRILGAADATRIAARFAVPSDAASESLLDFEAFGWATRTEFGGMRLWSLTDAGRAENERQLAAELDACAGRETIAHAHALFTPLNGAFLQAATDWQLRPLPGDPMAANDHTDFRWDDRVIDRLASIDRRLRPICDSLASVLSRFEGYTDRYGAAVLRVQAGERRWVDAIEIDSCHTVWVQLHEDLIATLGIGRDAPGS